MLIIGADWNPATKEVALSGSHHPFWSYCAAKTIAEQEVWKFTESHPGMDVTTSSSLFDSS